MKATIEPLEGNKVKVSVEVDETEFDKEVDAAFKRIAREVRIHGGHSAIQNGDVADCTDLVPGIDEVTALEKQIVLRLRAHSHGA